MLFAKKVKRGDLLQFACCSLGVLFVGIEEGILLAVLISLIMHLRRSMWPTLNELERLSGTDTWVDSERFTTTEVDKSVVVLRFNGELYFSNCKYALTLPRNLIYKL